MTRTEAIIHQLGATDRRRIANGIEHLLARHAVEEAWALVLEAIRLDLAEVEAHEAAVLARWQGTIGYWPDSEPDLESLHGQSPEEYDDPD